jgi:VanZ family protein
MNTLPLHYLKLWKGIGYLLVGVVVILSVISPSSNVELFRINDKIGHFLAYGTLMGWFAQWHDSKQYKYLATIFIAQGIGLEIVQTFLPERVGSFLDILANSLGVLIAWGLANTFLGKILFHFENTILRK